MYKIFLDLCVLLVLIPFYQINVDFTYTLVLMYYVNKYIMWGCASRVNFIAYYVPSDFTHFNLSSLISN